MWRTMHRVLAGLSTSTVLYLALSLLGVVAALDFASGVQISFALFYLVPVGLSAWYAGQRAGLAFAVTSSVVWYIVERAGGFPYDHPLIPVWNACVRLGFFVIVAVLLAALRTHLAVERRLARTDALTGTLNSRAFHSRIEHDFAIAGRLGHPVTLAYVDLDDFKRINDTYGHGAGDQVLRAVGRALRHATRRSDTVARLGGDEFALILPGTDADGARALLTTLRDTLPTLASESGPRVTCSVGAVVFVKWPVEADAAIAAADTLMYAVKREGKDALAVGIYSPATGQVLRIERPAEQRNSRARGGRHA